MPTKKSSKSTKKPVPVKTKEKPSKEGFFASLARFFYNPELYKTVQKRTFSRAFDRLLILLTIVSLTLTVLLGLGMWKIYTAAGPELQKMKDAYSDDLVMTFKDGTLEANVEQPYFLPTEPFTNHDSVEGTTPKYLITIDTVTPFSLEKMNEYESVLWLSKDTVYIWQSEGNLQFFPYPADLDRSFDKEAVFDLPDLVWSFAKFPMLFMGIAFFGMSVFFLVLGFIFYLAVVSFFWFFLSQLFGQKKEFETCYKLSIYALCPAILISAVLAFTFLFLLSLPTPPFTLTIFLIFFLLINGCFSKAFPTNSNL